MMPWEGAVSAGNGVLAAACVRLMEFVCMAGSAGNAGQVSGDGSRESGPSDWGAWKPSGRRCE